MKSKHYGIIAGGIVGIGSLFFFSLHGNPVKQSSLAALGLSLNPLVPFEQATSTQGSTAGGEAGAHPELPPGTYSLDGYFSIVAPEDFRFREIQDGSGTVVLAEGIGKGFQVFISPFDEPGPLTPGRIKKDLPQKVIKNPRTATLDGTKVLIFSSQEEGVGDVFEVWFVHGGSLYQITTTAAFADELQKILQTWQLTP